MLLENNGVRIRVEAPIDIDTHLRNGWVPVSEEPVVEEKSVEPWLADIVEPEAEVAPEFDPAILKAVELLSLDDPGKLAEFSDEDILALDGIGKAALKKIRAEFPVAPDEVEEDVNE